MTITKTALLIPRHKQTSFDELLLVNGDVKELNLNLIAPIRDTPEELAEVTRVERYMAWGTKTNPVVSISKINQDDDSYFITYDVQAEKLTQAVLGAICLHLKSNIEYLSFDGEDYLAKPFNYCQPVFDGDDAWFMVGLSKKTIDDVCMVFYNQTFEQYQLSN